jgi:anti-sigma B factor antagonist
MRVADLELERIVSEDGAPAIRVTGEIDMATAPQLRELLDELVDGGARRIVLDCNALAFLDSSGIGVLVAARSRLGESGDLLLDSPPAHVRKVLDITGVSEHLSIKP